MIGLMLEAIYDIVRVIRETLRDVRERIARE